MYALQLGTAHTQDDTCKQTTLRLHTPRQTDSRNSPVSNSTDIIFIRYWRLSAKVQLSIQMNIECMVCMHTGFPQHRTMQQISCPICIQPTMHSKTMLLLAHRCGCIMKVPLSCPCKLLFTDIDNASPDTSSILGLFIYKNPKETPRENTW